MQSILTGLIVAIALLYVANRWLPSTMKQKLFLWRAGGVSKSGHSSAPTIKPAGSCDGCSSCGGCGGTPTKIMQK